MRARVRPVPRVTEARRRWLAALVPTLLLSSCGEEAELEGPVPLFEEVPIEYPLALWDRGVEGTTILRVLVDEGGRIDSIAVLESSGHVTLDSAAVDGARTLRFEPARRGDELVSVWARVPVHFSIDPEGPR